MTAHTRAGISPGSTALQVVEGIDLTGKHAIVTGASSGIGLETARALAVAGATVTLPVRRQDAGEAAAKDILATAPHARVDVGRLDLAQIDSVRQFVANRVEPVDILIANAGVMALPTLELTDRGVEMQLAVNHLGHFALATGLHDLLAAGEGARIVVVASIGHRRGGIDFDDINFTHRGYDPWVAYAQSKTANILFAVEASTRWAKDGITVNALHPGGIDTDLDRHQGELYRANLERQFGGAENIPWKTREQGAATSVFLASSPFISGISGRYFEEFEEATITDQPLSPTGDHANGVARFALDPQNARRLWDVSEAFLEMRSAP